MRAVLILAALALLTGCVQDEAVPTPTPEPTPTPVPTPEPTPEPAPVADPVRHGPIPRIATGYKRDLTRVVQQEWGFEGSVALHAAQIHQESAWREDAKSWAGAEGLAQFMPSTAKWIGELYPDLGDVAPYTPDWSFRAQARYNKWIHARVVGHTDCDRWWHTLRSYNGGLGHLQQESRNATDAKDRHATDATCGSARRSVRHCPENLGYPQRILIEIEPRYLAHGWQGRPTCTG
jgi:hypothetical protein